ncbi:hypothetical protein GCM10009678_40210 [Actinomadura kijaniata]|uniref:Uncharacterized protein n=1 Tax=Actinomadura namibiensis TaxID=182080 RepID=A0A7W3QPS0_ACTNM|nr:hypothetical protein [Actinomadura namibiensis]MBA8954478.1 hypothetical protein [Actinomadura namibiensis]
MIEADAYERCLEWGWVKVAEFRVEPPFSDALMLRLSDGPAETHG